MTGDDPRLERLLAESEIRQVLARYGRAIDSLDFDLLRSCYHPDAIDEHGMWDGGIDGFIEILAEKLPHEVSTNHLMGASMIEVEGDTAWVETHGIGHHRSPANGDEPLRDRFFFIRYADRFERREGEWKIAHRVAIYEQGRMDPVTSSWTQPAPSARVGIREHGRSAPFKPT